MARIPTYDHLLAARPAGELLRRLGRQTRRVRRADRALLEARGSTAALGELEKRVDEADRKFDEQKVQQRRFVVDAFGFGTHLTIQQAAVAAAQAATVTDPTAVIYLNPGTYVENVVVDVAGSDLKALSFVAEGVHGSASDLVFPSEVAAGEQFITSVVIEPDDSTVETITFTGDAAGELFVGFQGIKIEGNLHVVDSGNFTARIRLVDSFVDYTGSAEVFTTDHASAEPDVLLLRSLVVANGGALFSGTLQFQLFASMSRIEVEDIENTFHTGSADINNPFLGTIAALQTCHLEIGKNGFINEYLFLLLISTTVLLLDNVANPSRLMNAVVKGNLGLIGMVIIDDQVTRTLPVVELDGSSGLVTGTSFYGRGDIDPFDATPEGQAVRIHDTNVSNLTIVHNRFIAYDLGVFCDSVNSLSDISIIGPNAFTLVTTPYTDVRKSALYQWPVQWAAVLMPTPISYLATTSGGVPIVAAAPTTTTAFVGLVHVESPIQVDSLSYRHSGFGSSDAVVRIAVYTDNGGRVINVTDAVGAAGAGQQNVTVSPSVQLAPGNYYFFFCLASGTTAALLHLYNTYTFFASPTGSDFDLEGDLTITGGNAPSLIGFTAITTPKENRTPVLRLDGVLI